MSLVSKDSIIKACADAYKEGAGVESVKVGELAAGILAAIGAGGGSSLPDGWATGEFNTTEETLNGGFTIEHGLGKMPNVVIIYRDSMALEASAILGMIRFNFSEMYDEEIGYVPEYSIQRMFATSTTNTVQGGQGSTYEDNRETFVVPTYSTGYIWRTSHTFKWIAIAL